MVFLAIAETGSFAGAARRLGRANSVISYAIANLESQLGVSLLERAGRARPKLTDAGRAILSDSRGVAIALDGLLAKARGLNQGLEAEDGSRTEWRIRRFTAQRGYSMAG